MEFDDRDLHTETFSNARGWTAIRVTHQPTGVSAERTRGETLRSAVQAQRQCIDELRRRLEAAAGPDVAEDEPSDRSPRAPAPDVPVSRKEFDALAARVAALEAGLRRAGSRR